MSTTTTFYVSSSDNKIRRCNEPSREYFVPGGKKEGKAKYIIEVFGGNHETVAKELRDMLDASGMSDKIYKIKVESR
jgi:hypothetical protein